MNEGKLMNKSNKANCSCRKKMCLSRENNKQKNNQTKQSNPCISVWLVTIGFMLQWFSICLSTGIPTEFWKISLNSAIWYLAYFACLSFHKMSVHGRVFSNFWMSSCPAAISTWQERALPFDFFITFVHISLSGFSATLKASLLDFFFLSFSFITGFVFMWTQFYILLHLKKRNWGI